MAEHTINNEWTVIVAFMNHHKAACNYYNNEAEVEICRSVTSASCEVRDDLSKQRI